MIIYITIDFDGTIVDHAFPEIGQPAPHAIETIKWLKSHTEVKLILHTMRSYDMRGQDLLTDAIEYCRSNGIEFDYINENPTQNNWTTSKKIYSHYNIDNNNAGCPMIRVDNDNFYSPCVDWLKIKEFFEYEFKLHE